MWAIAGLALLFLTLTSGMLTNQSLFVQAGDFIAQFEGFISVSKWDYKQYSWGFGTKAPGPGLSITREQALQELNNHVQQDYTYLAPLVLVPLNNNQWAALLSFSYNEGPYNADNLVKNINNQDWDALGNQWQLYNKVQNADGSYFTSADLVERRAAEWQLFTS